MSFSSTTKNELSRLPLLNDHCALAELSALVRMCGTIQILGENKFNLKFNTENAAIARRIFSILKLLYDIDVAVMVRRNRQLKKNNNYLVGINDIVASKKVLVDVGFIKEDGSNIFHPDYKMPKDILKLRCCRRAYVRGSFLGGASISNPEKTYHLEFVTNYEEHAQDLSNIINSFSDILFIITAKLFLKFAICLILYACSMFIINYLPFLIVPGYRECCRWLRK